MKKTLIAGAFALGLTALPALAGSTTVEFVTDAGETSVVVFSDDGTAMMNGEGPITYTMDEATKTICGATPDGELCATFEEMGDVVGFATGYTNTEGASGTATITAIEE